jgi:hypothetical protein
MMPLMMRTVISYSASKKPRKGRTVSGGTKVAAMPSTKAKNMMCSRLGVPTMAETGFTGTMRSTTSVITATGLFFFCSSAAVVAPTCSSALRPYSASSACAVAGSMRWPGFTRFTSAKPITTEMAEMPTV